MILMEWDDHERETGKAVDVLYIVASTLWVSGGVGAGARHPSLRSPYIGGFPPSPQSYTLSLQHNTCFLPKRRADVLPRQEIRTTVGLLIYSSNAVQNMGGVIQY